LRKKGLPSYKIGGRIKFDEEEIKAWYREQKEVNEKEINAWYQEQKKLK
jgi:hypothetical protein